jgi:hypothetical protein
MKFHNGLHIFAMFLGNDGLSKIVWAVYGDVEQI